MDLTDELRDNLLDGDRQNKQAVIICLQFLIGKLQEQKARDAVLDLDNILHVTIETSGIGMYTDMNFVYD